ncbi:MAG: hypothetical protein GY838_19740 [bacterium]|nr:hypothetical protein [bacterium]
MNSAVDCGGGERPAPESHHSVLGRKPLDPCHDICAVCGSVKAAARSGSLEESASTAGTEARS